MLATLAVLLMCGSPPADEKPKQQESGSVSSTTPGVPVAVPKIVREDGKPPMIIYPPSRASKKWIDVGNLKVAVDEGIEWQGKIAYFAITDNLVIVDAKSEKTL